jgi:hypothetical protein
MRFLKPGRPRDRLLLEDLDRDQRDHADERANAQRDRALADVHLVVVEAVALVPQARSAERVHRVDDRDVVLEELRSEVLVRRVVLRELDRDREHRPAVERHPRGAVGLVEQPPEGSGAERSNTPMLSRPRKPPAKMCLPLLSLRLTHQLKLSSSLWKTRFRKSTSRAPLPRRSCRRAMRPRRARAG